MKTPPKKEIPPADVDPPSAGRAQNREENGTDVIIPVDTQRHQSVLGQIISGKEAGPAEMNILRIIIGLFLVVLPCVTYFLGDNGIFL